MPVGAASWSFTEDDFGAITTALEQFLTDCDARCALLVDRTGQLVATVGDRPNFDPTAFSTLAAADFRACANATDVSATSAVRISARIPSSGTVLEWIGISLC